MLALARRYPCSATWSPCSAVVVAHDAIADSPVSVHDGELRLARFHRFEPATLDGYSVTGEAPRMASALLPRPTLDYQGQV